MSSCRRLRTAQLHRFRDVQRCPWVTVWGEGLEHADARRIYPDGIHEAVAAAIRSELGDGAAIRTATLADPEHGLPRTCWRHRRSPVVGPSRARGRERRRRRPGGPARARRDGPRRPPLEPLFEAVPPADGDPLRPPVAQRRRARGRLDGRAGARHRRGRATRVRHSGARDVRGTSTSRRRTSSSSSAPSRAARCFEAAAAGPGGRAGSSTSVPGTRRFPSTGSRRSRVSSRTPSGGRAGDGLRSRRRRRRSRPWAGTVARRGGVNGLDDRSPQSRKATRAAARTTVAAASSRRPCSSVAVSRASLNVSRLPSASSSSPWTAVTCRRTNRTRFDGRAAPARAVRRRLRQLLPRQRAHPRPLRIRRAVGSRPRRARTRGLRWKRPPNSSRL